MKHQRHYDNNFQMQFWSGFHDSINTSYLRGFFDAEGSIRKTKPHISLGNTDIELMERIIDLLCAIGFKVSVRNKTTPSNAVPYCEIDIFGFAQVYEWFSLIGSCLERKIANWEAINKSYPYRNSLAYDLGIPQWRIDADYMRGFFDGEGSLVYTPRTHSIRLRIAITDYELLFNIHKFLVGLGLPFAFRDNPSANKGNKRIWSVDIGNFGLVEKWFDIIGTSSSKHLHR